MSLLKKMFGSKPAGASYSRASQPPDSIDDSSLGSRNAARRDLVHVALRDAMLRHGIPSEWIECRTLSMVQSNKSTGTYVTLIVRGGQDRLLPYVLAFQASLRQELERFDPRLDDWLRGLAWQFEDAAGAPAGAPAGASIPGMEVAETAEVDDDLQRDLQALFAIRDAAIAGGKEGPTTDFQPTQTQQ